MLERRRSIRGPTRSTCSARSAWAAGLAAVLLLLIAGCDGGGGEPAATALRSAEESASSAVIAAPTSEPPAPEEELAASARPSPETPAERLADKYADLGLIDIHNHDAAKYSQSLPTWDRYRIGKVVLFGNVSEPSATETDAMAWEAYREYPDRIYPFFSGFDMHSPAGLDVVREQLEKGYLGVGETAAASSFSPVLAHVAWKAEHPMDANLPEVYELCAEYGAPILLHIDPPSGYPVLMLGEALDSYPDTLFIFAHANVYQDADSIGMLLEAHPNLLIDFFAGFTSYSSESPFRTEQYVELIEKYPDRFMLSTDGAFGMTYDEAIPAMYETLDLLKPETRKKVASGNFQRIVDAQKPTRKQLERLQELGGGEKAGADPDTLSRHEMNKLLFRLEASGG